MLFSRAVSGIGSLVVEPLLAVGRLSLYASSVVPKVFSKEWDFNKLVGQMHEFGVSSLPMILMVSFFMGMVVSVNTVGSFIRFGAENYVGGIGALTMIRELSPLLSGILVTGRVGSAMAAEIGSMKITEQIDALLTFGIDPVAYIGVPRVLAGVLMVPLLNIFSMVVGIAGEYFMAVMYSGIASGVFHASVADFLELKDIWGSLLKSLVFGFIVSVVGCAEGFASTGGARGVGYRTTMSVVVSINLILFMDYVISLLVWGGVWGGMY